MLRLPMMEEKVPDCIAGAIQRFDAVAYNLYCAPAMCQAVALMKHSLGQRGVSLDAPSTMQVIVQIRRVQPVSHRPIATLTLVPHP